MTQNITRLSKELDHFVRILEDIDSGKLRSNTEYRKEVEARIEDIQDSIDFLLEEEENERSAKLKEKSRTARGDD
jgi:hypothetical protein